jgi:hypothetical protein
VARVGHRRRRRRRISAWRSAYRPRTIICRDCLGVSTPGRSTHRRRVCVDRWTVNTPASSRVSVGERPTHPPRACARMSWPLKGHLARVSRPSTGTIAGRQLASLGLAGSGVSTLERSTRRRGRRRIAGGLLGRLEPDRTTALARRVDRSTANSSPVPRVPAREWSTHLSRTCFRACRPLKGRLAAAGRPAAR